MADNRPGAGGNVGAALAAKSPPDGYTILIATASIAVSPLLYFNLAYEASKDLAPVARLSREIIRALETPDLRERLTALSVEPWPGTQERKGHSMRAFQHGAREAKGERR